MPKAWPVDILEPHQPLAQGAALILAVKLPEVLSFQEAARGGSVDSIHDMRVASKRLREALRVLRPALPEDSRKLMLQEVEELNDSLGAVRDCDVIAEVFAALAEGNKQARDLSALCAELKKQRRRYHRQFVRFLGKLDDEGFAIRYAAAMAEMASRTPEGQPTVISFAAEAVQERLQDVVANWQAARRPNKIVPFHRQRIRVKKLKYALEPFLTLLPRDLAPLYDWIADLQELMGLVHDCDVQSSVLTKWVKRHSATDGTALAERAILGRRRKACRELRVLVGVMDEGNWAPALEAIVRGAAASVA